MSNLPQQFTINQYLGNGTTTVFTYSYLVPLDVDINVYVTPSGQTPIPMSDIKILNTDYTVQNAGTINGGTITFISGAPPASSIVTLSRNVSNQIDTEFVQAQNFNGENLDDAFEREMLCIQQNTTFLQQRSLTYPVNGFLPSNSNDTNVPVLGNQQIWQKVGGAIQAVTLEENPDVSTLRSQLASQVPSSDGVSLIGYYDVNNSAPQTLANFLNNLPAYIENIIIENASPTGTRIESYNPVPPNGWITMVNGSIGSAISGATVYANADAINLFSMFWNNYSNALCPVSGGRGASAAADFAANKTLTVPSENGCAAVNYFGAYTPGLPVGDAQVTLGINEMPPHQHSLASGLGYAGNNNGDQTNSGPTSTGNVGASAANHTDNTGGFGGVAQPFDIIPPSIPVYVYIKL